MAAAGSAVVLVVAGVSALIWLEPSGWNKIFMMAKKGNIKLYKPTSCTILCADTYLMVGKEKHASTVVSIEDSLLLLSFYYHLSKR